MYILQASYVAKDSFACTRSRLALPYCVDWPLKASVRVAGYQIMYNYYSSTPG